MHVGVLSVCSMTPESPFTAVAQVPCDLPALSIGEADSRGVAPPTNYNRTLQGHQHKQSHHAIPSHGQHAAYSTSPSDHYQPPHGHTVNNTHTTRQQTHFRTASGGQSAQQKRSPQPNSLLSALANKGSTNGKSNNGNNAPTAVSTPAAGNKDDGLSSKSNHIGQRKLAAPSPDRKGSESSPGAPPREGGTESESSNFSSSEQHPSPASTFATPSAKSDAPNVSDSMPSCDGSSPEVVE